MNELMNIGAWLLDGDGDGLADGLDVSIVVADGLHQRVYLAAAELAARLGLEVTALTLPVCQADTEPSPGAAWKIIAGGQNRLRAGDPGVPPLAPGQGRAVLCGRNLLIDGSDAAMASLLHYLATEFPERIPAEGADAVLVDGEQFIWFDHGQAVGRFSLPKPVGSTAAPATTLACLSKLYSIDGLFADTDEDFLPDDWSIQSLPVAGTTEEWVSVINLAARWGLETLGLTFTGMPSDGQAEPVILVDDSARPGIRLSNGRLQVGGNVEQRVGAWRYLAEHYPETPVGMNWGELALYLEGLVRERPIEAGWQEVSLEWEVDEVKCHWLEIIGQAPGPISAEVRVSEPLPVRQQLAAEMKQMAQEFGVDASITVRCAYKQGLHWIREEVIPELRLHEQIDKITVEFAPFLAADSLDPKVRWLLELYPVDHVLANSLGISPEQITFELNNQLENTYRLSAWCEGNLLLARTMDTWYTSQPYLPRIAEKPLVHPPTGGILVESGSRSFRRILTDAERVFSVYQTEILPRLLSTADGSEGLCASNQPFFERLDVEVSISEPEETLGVREEMVSVADALHEDIYFVGLDLFKRLGDQAGQVLRAPGLILPNIRVSEGQRPSLRYRLEPKHREQSISRPILTAISLHGDRVDGSEWEFEMGSEAEAARVSRVLQREDRPDGLSARITLCYPGGSLPVEVRLRPEALCSEKPDTDDVIYLEQCAAHLSRLKEREGMLVRLAGVSRQGRHIYSIAATSKGTGITASVAKQAGWKPTWLLNNRHHANEVSSTSAALELMQSLTEDSRLSEVLRVINVVCIPLENVDGAAVHQQLAEVNPRHKLHAARFNSQGREFADAYFQDDATVPEARALPDTWRQWVPDVVVDNHGIPSHEWEQPFSGYLCPWFTSFWIPRSLFYAYFWLMDEPGHLGSLAAAGLEKTVTRRLTDDPEIDQRNQELLASWRKYFVPYLDDHFSGEERAGIMWYYVPYRTPHGRFASHRWPKLTILDWTTEVADETARDGYLSMCSRAHRTAQEACLEWLASQPVTLDEVARLVGSGFRRKRCRRRPLSVSGAGDGNHTHA